MAETKFGFEIDGNRLTVVETLEENAISVKTIAMENIKDSIALLLAGTKEGKGEGKLRGSLVTPGSAIRRIDVNLNSTKRVNFEKTVYEAITVNPEISTAAGIFLGGEELSLDKINPGVAVVASVELINSAYRNFSKIDIELVTPPFAYRYYEGLWLALRYETAELTLVKNNRAVASRILQTGGLNTVVGLLADPNNASIGQERLQAALTTPNSADPLAVAELERYLAKVVNEIQQTVKFWNQNGEEVSNDIFILGPGAQASTLEALLNQINFKKIYPEAIYNKLSLIQPVSDRELAVSAWCSAISIGEDMPQAAFINTVKIEEDEKERKAKSLKTRLYLLAALLSLGVLSAGLPYLLGLTEKIQNNSNLNKALNLEQSQSKEISIYNDITLRNNLVTLVRNNEPSWSKVLNESLSYQPAGTQIESLQSSRNGNILTVVLVANIPGNAYQQIANWLNSIKVNGLARDAWLSSFSVRNNTTNCQITYNVDLRTVKENNGGK